MKIEDYFGFGKYEGIRLIDVFRGTLNIDRKLLKNYVHYLLNTDIRHHYRKNFGSISFELVDEFEISESEIKTLEFRETGINDSGVPYGEFFEFPIDIEKELELCLSIGNQKAGYEIGGFCSLANFSKNHSVRLIVGADPQYLCWCIKNVDGFCINASDIDKLEKLKIVAFHGIHVVRKESGVYEYAPNLEVKHYQFPKIIKLLNQAKNEKLALENDGNHEEYDDGPSAYGYSSWEEMSFYEAYEGDSDTWAHDNQ